ncbi:MAG: 50S ribosomal protein L29 [Chloroflexota bacterium]|jgi:large subunit ribosomal protein L29|nr:50S ribosomal protein L29 [Chloroflexota bacterium]NCA12781.1 50S ribosomal protein L29 [Pseudomonadota bacterium]
MASQATELRALDPAELARRLGDKRQELFNLRFQLATRKIKDYTQLRLARRDVARILTVMGESRRGA